MRWIVAIISLLVLSLSAQAQAINRCSNTQTPCWSTASRPVAPGQGAFGYNTDTGIVEFFNGTTWTSSTDGTINCRAFGSIGNAVHDDNDNPVTGAINACIAYAHTFTSGGGTATLPVKIVLPPGNYKISNPINMTGWGATVTDNGWAVTFSAYGANIFAAGTAAAINGNSMFDMMGSTKLRIEGLTILGGGCDPAATPSPSPTGAQPNTGIQGGRITAAGAGGHKFTDVTIKGCYSLGGLYLFASEENSFINIVSQLSTRSANAYNLVMDGSNRFNVPTYATQTNPIGTVRSFIGNAFWKGAFSTTGSNTANGGLQVPIYISGAADQVIFTGTYLSTFLDPAGRCVDVVVLGNTSNRMLNWDFTIHCEGTITNIFKFYGPFAALIVKNLRYREHITGAIAPATLASIFANGDVANVTSISMPNLFVELGNLAPFTGTIFDTPATYVVSGYVSVPTLAVFNTPSQWSGTVCIQLPNVGAIPNCTNTPARVTFANLPACNAANVGMFAILTNSAVVSTPTYWTIAAPGGTLDIPVVCDGTNWRYH